MPKSHDRASAPSGRDVIHERKFSTREAAAVLGVAPATLVEWRCRGGVKLPFVRVGHAIRYLESDLRRFLEERRVAGAA